MTSRGCWQASIGVVHGVVCSIGMKITPIIRHAGLEGGKYTRWVLRLDFSNDHLLCLLRMIGEFDAGVV